MANITKTVDIVFGGKNDLDKTIRDINHSFDRLDTAIMGVAEPLAGFGNKILEIDAALTVLAAGGLFVATKAAGEFNDQINEISTLTSLSGDNLDKFGQDILDYSRDSKKSIEDINEAIYQSISLGVDYADSLKLIEKSERLAIAGKADLKGSTELLASTLNAYGEIMDEATRYSDVFFQTVKFGKTTIPELSASLSKVSGIAATAKVPIETLAASIAALTATGMDTAEATTALRGIISSIIDPPAKAAKTAASLGISFNAVALASKGLDGVLKEVYQTTGGNVEKIAGLFENVRALNGALILGSDSAGRFEEALQGMQNAAGATETAYEKMAENFAFINQNLVNNIKSTIIEIGQPLVKDYAKIVEGIKALFKGFDVAFDAEAFKPLYDALGEFATNTVDLLKKIAEALPEALQDLDYSGLISSLKELADVFLGFLDGLDPTKPEDLAEGFQKVIDTVESLVRVTTGMAVFFKEIYVEIQKAITAFNDLDDTSQEAFGNVLGAAQFVVQAGTKIALAVLAIKASGAKIEAVFSRMAGTIQTVFYGAQVVFDSFIWSVLNGLEIFYHGLNVFTLGMSETIGQHIRDIQDYKAAAASLFADAAKDTYEGAKTIIYGFEEQKKASKNTTDSMKDDIGKVNEALDDGKSWIKYRDVSIGNMVDFSTNIAEKSVPKIIKGMNEIKNSQGEIVQYWEDSSGVTHFEKLGEAAEEVTEIMEKIPKSVEVELAYRKADLSQFEAETNRIDDLLDFEASIKTKQFEVDIKTLEAQTETLKANFESIAEIFKNTGETSVGIMGALAGTQPGTRKWDAIEKQLKQENKRRDEALKLQKELTEAQKEQVEAQRDLLKAKEQRVSRGEALIKIEAEGLKPHLEAIWMEVMEEIQIKGTDEGVDFLIGI